VAVAAAAALVGISVLSIPLAFPNYPASHAPSFAVLAKLHSWGWSRTEIRLALAAAVSAAAAALIVLPWLRRRPGEIGRIALAVVCAAVVSWALAAELEADASATSYARVTTERLPRPLDWVDRATGGARTVYIGQRVSPRNEVLSLEFWNRSIIGLFRLDYARGHELVPVKLGRNAIFPVATGARYVVADYGITPVGRPVAHRGRWTLYSVPSPLRLASAVRGVYGDGWMGKEAAYWQYARARAGAARIALSTTLSCRANSPLTGTISLTGLSGAATPSRRPVALGSCNTKAIELPARSPFRLDVRLVPTFVPADAIPRSIDPRRLTAQVRFSFESRTPRSQ
jgi:hypothetical protein